jgi:hypothetical protein
MREEHLYELPLHEQLRTLGASRAGKHVCHSLSAQSQERLL